MGLEQSCLTTGCSGVTSCRNNDITRAGTECWDICGKRGGPCSWCGPTGFCCRRGWDTHVCGPGVRGQDGGMHAYHGCVHGNGCTAGCTGPEVTRWPYVNVGRGEGYSSSGVRWNQASSPCNPCEAGKFKPGSGGAACTACPAGKYQGEEGKSFCSNCVRGKYSKNVGSAVDVSDADWVFAHRAARY